MESLVSVITVCYNAQTTIRKTIESVLIQSYRPLQYIVIDGNSSDSTLDILDEYQAQFEEARIDMIIVSERDSGIYNAMNKGIRFANGDWILFMNSDDYFYDKHVLSTLTKYYEDHTIDVIYGDEYVFDLNGNGVVNKRKGDISKIEKTLPFCHQSSLVRKKWLIAHPFEEQYHIVADYEFFLYCYSNNAKFKYSNTIIASYFKGGISRKSFRTAIDESYKVKVRYGIINDRRLDLKIKRELRKIYTCFQLRKDK